MPAAGIIKDSEPLNADVRPRDLSKSEAYDDEVKLNLGNLDDESDSDSDSVETGDGHSDDDGRVWSHHQAELEVSQELGTSVPAVEDHESDYDAAMGVEPAIAMPVARAPSVEKVQERRVNHAQFQPWCPHCQAGRGLTGRHRRRNKKVRRTHSEGGIPISSMGYMRMERVEQ